MALVTLVSGGLDSTLMAVLSKEQGLKQFPLFVDYGQLSARRELSACRANFRKLHLPSPAVLRVPGYGGLIKSGITDRRRNMVREAFLAGRNTLLLLAGAAFARQKRAESVCIGLLDEAHHLFPDQTSHFLASLQHVLRDSVAYPVSIKAPLAQFTKQAVVEVASKRGITGTYSCHRGGKIPCGKCISCAEFNEA